MAASIELLQLTKRFGPAVALDHVSLDIPPNTIYGLLGPNGAGKTTLFSLVAGFLKPTSGAVKVLGIGVEQISELRGRLSILPQDALFQANVPILEQMIFFCELSGYHRGDAEKEAMRALEIVGLAESAKKNARVLSHGMSKRLGIAQAFLGKPEVILLDEPTAGLDPANANAIRNLIRELQTSATLVISSHNLPEIQEMCSHVAILDKGKLVEASAVAAITQAGTIVRITFARPLSQAALQAMKGVAGVSDVAAGEGGEYTITMTPSPTRGQEDITAEVVQKLAAQGTVPRSITDGVSLESRFLQVTGTKR